MAHVFPLTAEKFLDLFFITDDEVMGFSDVSFAPARNDQVSGMGSNQPLNAELASPLWKVDVTSASLCSDDAEAIASLVEVLERPGNDFYIYNPRKRGPREDRDGALLGSSEPEIAVLDPNNHQISVSGLPSGYVLSRGDMFAFEYGPTGQKRRALHRFGETVSASSGGTTPLVEVFPHIRVGATTGTLITLIKPAMRAKIIPGTYRISGAEPKRQVITFSAIQKLI